MNFFTLSVPRILSLFVVLLLVKSAAAQTGSISGRVLTRDRQPAPDVQVHLSKTQLHAITDGQGHFQLNHLQPGSYTLVVSMIGLRKQERTVTLQDGQQVKLEYELAENAQQLEDVIVSAQRSINEKPATIGKIAIRPKDLPQSVTVLDKEVLERQQVLRLGDALQNVTGVYIMGTTGGYQEEIAGRGYTFGSSNTFKNGARYNNAAMPEMSGVEKLEFLKGGSAILFGNVQPGGIMNIITKKPRFENGGEISFRTGSYDFYKPVIDLYGSLNNRKTAAFRINTTYEKSRSFRDVVSGERFYINPSFLFKLGAKTELLVEGDYLKDTRTPDYGIGGINYQINNVPRHTFLGTPWAYNKAQQGTVTATLTHQLNDRWQLRGMTSYQDYDVELYSTARPASTSIKADGTWARGLQKSKSQEKYYVGQVDLTGRFKTGSMAHTLLIGADADRYTTGSYTFATAGAYDTINVFNPATFNKRQDIPYVAPATFTRTPITRFGAYVQDLVSLTAQLKLLAGVRYSYQNNKQALVDTFKNNRRGYVAAYTNDAFSPRAGIVYQPWKNVSLFTSYTNTFLVNTGVDVNNQALKPSIVDQYEAGAKTDLLNGLLSANLTVYRIVNSNFSQSVIDLPAGAPAGAKELAGKVTSKGVEVDLATKCIYGFTMMAGYSYNDTRYAKVTGFKGNDRLRYNPAHTANGSIYYAFGAKTALRGFNLGLNLYYVGDRVAGRNTTTTSPNNKLMPLPDYTLTDIGAGYASGNYSVRVKVTNLFNTLSYNVHDDNSINPIAPRQFSTTVAYRF